MNSAEREAADDDDMDRFALVKRTQGSRRGGALAVTRAQPVELSRPAPCVVPEPPTRNGSPSRDGRSER